MTHLSLGGLHAADIMPHGFVMAMRARMTLAEAATPWLRAPQPDGWLLVARWGEEGEYLSVGHAGAAPVDDATPAPPALSPRATWIGRSSPTPADPPLTDRFELLRSEPAGTVRPGRFLPGDGVVWFGRRGDTHRLTLRGRVAPDPGSTLRSGVWHIEAEQVDWLGETYGTA